MNFVQNSDTLVSGARFKPKEEDTETVEAAKKAEEKKKKRKEEKKAKKKKAKKTADVPAGSTAPTTV